MAEARVLHGLIQLAKKSAERFCITPRRSGGWSVWYEFEDFGWRMIGHSVHHATAVEFAAQECARLAEGPR